MKKRFWSVLLALAMVLTMLPATAMAGEEDSGETSSNGNVVQIASNEDLVNAILNQQDGQTWMFIQAGTYDAKNTTDGSAGNYSVPAEVYSYPFALPIYKNNITITKAPGVGEVVLTSTYTPAETSGGNWHDQNFITVYGTGLTISGISLQANRNLYYGTCNKVIELAGSAKDFTLENVNIIPLSNDEGTSFGGSIYFNVNDAGNSRIQNVTMDAWISASKVTAGTITINGLTQDFSNSEYAGYSYPGYGYAWNPSVNGNHSGITVTNYTVVVGENTNLTEQVFNSSLRAGTTVRLASDIAVDKMLDIAANGVTLDLGGHTLTASDNFSSTYENDSHLVNVTGANVTIKNGTLQTTAVNKNVLNAYGATGMVVENLTIDHTNASKGAPVVVNGSDMTVKGSFSLVTGATSWYAMNVDSQIEGKTGVVTFSAGSSVNFGGDATKAMIAVNSGSSLITPENAGLVATDMEGIYVKGFTVQFVSDNTVLQTSMVVPGTQFTLPAAPSKDSYLFSGWSDGTNTYNAGDVVTINQNTTFTALWTYLPPVIVPPTTGGTTGGNSSTVTNPDGSTTTTVTKPDGTVTVTDKDTQGNVTETITNPNGTSTTTVTNTNGSSSVTTVDQTGKVQAQVKLPQNVIANAAGEAVTLPVAAVPATSNQAAAPVVSIDLPAGVSAKVEVPVVNATAGTVAVLVNADGSQEIVKTSVTTADGVVLTVEDGATVMIVDNSKDFADVSATYWGSDAIDFATSRDLFNGTSATTFSPEADMNRAMIVTVLARLEGVDTTGGSTWYEAGWQWAISAGISDGSDMNGSVTREQLAAMLYRYAGSPAVNGAAVAGFADADNVSDWAADAMAWAVSQGIISGMGGQLNPQGDATRAQVATILMRFIATL